MKSFFASLLCGVTLAFAAPAMAAPAADCQTGAYRLADGSTVDVSPSDDDTLRWRLFTGETGLLHRQGNGKWTSTYGATDRPDGKTVSFDCGKGTIAFGPENGRRIPFDVSDT